MVAGSLLEEPVPLRVRKRCNHVGSSMSPRSFLLLPGGWRRFHPALIGWLMALLAAGIVQASAIHPETPVQPANVKLASDFSPIELTRADTRYALASSEHSSGFMPAPDELTLEQAPDFVPRGHSFGLSPDFGKHSRYWLFTRVVNKTENSDWVLHISNFGFQPRILIDGSDGRTLQPFGNSAVWRSADINTIGRAIEVDLQAGQSYLVVVELTARTAAWHPYVALMSAAHYQDWKIQQDLAYKIAIGIILGLVLLGFLCSVVTREKTFFWAAVSSLLMLLYYLEHSSLPALLWQSTYEKTAFFWMLISFTLLSQLAFAASFLQIDRRCGGWYRTFIATASATAVVCIAGTAASFQVNTLLYALNYAIVGLVILGSGFAKFLREGKYYIIYLLGWLPMVLSILQVTVVLHGPERSIGEVSASYKMIEVLYVQILHMFMHAIALALRVRSLREEKLKTECLSQAKSRFIAQSSHDLSQPLHSMRIFLDHLQRHVHGSDGNRIFRRLQDLHRHLGESFKSLMDLSKLESGGITPELEPVPLRDLLRRLHAEYRVLAAEKAIQLVLQPSSMTVLSDPILLERMLRNLISNAIKYTDKGKVIVGCRRRGRQVAIQVLDSGRGIDKQAREHIFDIYRRSVTQKKQEDGSGIGLSIVKHISELLDHPVTLASSPGRGSCFTISAPRLTAMAQGELETLNPVGEMPLVALVFQDGAIRQALVERLREWQCPVLTFDTVEAACRSSAPAALLLCEYSCLMGAPSQYASRLAQQTVAACVRDADNPSLPENWIGLATAAPPAQLRALLNLAARRRQLKSGLDAPR